MNQRVTRALIPAPLEQTIGALIKNFEALPPMSAAVRVKAGMEFHQGRVTRRSLKAHPLSPSLTPPVDDVQPALATTATERLA